MRPDRPRIALMVVLLAAAMPVRIPQTLPAINSVSVLDLLLIAMGVTLLLDVALHAVDIGDRQVFGLLCIPLVLTTASLWWSQDPAGTVRIWLTTAEGVLAYLFVVREMRGLTTERVVRYIRRFTYLLILPAVFLALGVPGFEPVLPGVKHSAGDYLSFYTRLSHPVLGRSNNLAAVLAFFVPVLLYCGAHWRDRRTTVAGYVALIAVFLTLSRGTLAAFIIAAVLYAPFARRRSQPSGLGRRIGVGLLVGTAGTYVFYAIDPTVQEFFAGRLTTTNFILRSQILSVAIEKLAARPWLGYGAGVVPDHDPYLMGNAHNTYVQLMLAFGMALGLLAGLALIALVVRFRGLGRVSPLGGVLAYTVLVQLVSFAFEASFEGTVLRVLFYLSIGMGVALVRSTSPRDEPDISDAVRSITSTATSGSPSRSK